MHGNQWNRWLVLATACSACALAQAQDARPIPGTIELNSTPTLTVAGRGEVFATPDRAIVRLGAEAQAPEATDAQAKVNENMTKALAEIRKVGVEQNAIQTMGLNLFPVYSQNPPGREADAPRVTGFRAANTIQVKVDDLTLVGKIIDAGVAAGVNRLEGVTFELQNELPYRKRALQDAIGEAREKAAAMAPALDVKLGKLREVIEGGVAVEPPQPFFGRAMRAGFSVMDTPVQPGELRVEASVTLRYEILP